MNSFIRFLSFLTLLFFHGELLADLASRNAAIQQYNKSTSGGNTSALQAEIAKLKDQLSTATGRTIPELQKKIQDLEVRVKGGTGGGVGTGANNAGNVPKSNGNVPLPSRGGTPPPSTGGAPPPPVFAGAPPPPPPPGSTLPAGVTKEMEGIRKAFFDKYKLVAKKIKDGKYPPGLWAKVEDIATHSRVQSKVASEIKRATDNYVASKALLDEFIKAYAEKKTGVSKHKNHLYKWFVYLTDFALRAGKYKKITWPVKTGAALTDGQYWKLMLTLKGNYNLMVQDLKEVLEKEAKAARKAEKSEKDKSTKGKFKFRLGDTGSVKKDIGRLFTVPLFRAKLIAHYGDLLITKKTTDPDSQKAAEALFSWSFERLVLPFLPSDVSAITLQGDLRVGLIKAVQAKGIEDQAALEVYLKDQAKAKALMKAMDEAIKAIIVAKGIPAIRKGAPPLSIPTIGKIQPEYEQVLLFAIQGKLNKAVEAPLQKLLDDTLEKAPIPGGAAALEAKLVGILKAGLSKVFAGHQSIVLELKGEVVGYDFWTWTKSFENPSAKLITTSQAKMKSLLEAYQKDLADFHAGTKTLPPFMQPINDLGYSELPTKIDDAFLTQYAKLILQRVASVMKENKSEYGKIKDSNKEERELILTGVEAVKSPLNKFLSIKDSKISGSGDMKQEAQPYVDMLIAAHLLQE